MSRNYLPFAFVVCLWAWGGIAPARAQTVMSLSDAILYAYEHNPNVRIAQIQIKDADWRIRENKAGGLPQVTAGLSYQYFFQPPIAVLPKEFGIDPNTGEPDPNFDRTQSFALKNTVGGSIGVSQLLFSNSYRIAVRASEYYRALVQQQYEVAKQTVRNQVTDAYLPALLIEQNLGIFDKNITNLEKLLSETEAIQKAGFAEQLDVDRLQLSLSNLRTERTNLIRQRSVVINALKMAAGYPIGDSLTLSDNLDKLLNDYAQADLSSQVNYQNRAEYLQLLRGQELSRLDVELNSRTWLPSVVVSANYQPAFSGNNLFNEAFYTPQGLIALGLNFNLYDGGAARSRRERAVLSLQTIAEQQTQLESAIQLEVENARKLFSSAAERVRSQRQNVELAERIFNTTSIKFRNGVGSSFEMSTAEQQLYQAQQNLIQSQYDLLSATVAVRRALGGR